MDTKICKKCLIEKPLTCFYKQKRNKDGYWNSCSDCDKKKYRENVNEIKRKVSEYRKNNKEKVKETKKNHYYKNREKILKQKQGYGKKNRENRRIMMYNKYHNDDKFKIITNIRVRVKIFLKTKNINKSNTINNIVGCSPQFLKEYLEQKFTEGMSWGNYGVYGWHIDHIIPLSSANTEEEIYKLCHYTNLQPLWAEDNLKKGSKIL
jgi:hypothetical protein